MKLKKVEITNFRCFKTISVPLNTDLNVFVGINGSGKTTLLDALAISLYDIIAANGGGGSRQRKEQGATLRPSDIRVDPDISNTLSGRSSFVQIRAQAGEYYALPEFQPHTNTGALNLIEWTDFIQFRSPSKFIYDTSNSERLNKIHRYFEALWREIDLSAPSALIPLPVVAYYRANRRLAEMPKIGDIFSINFERQDAFKNSLNAGVNYQSMCQWFYLRENQELRERIQSTNNFNFAYPDLAAVRRAIEHAIDGVRRVFFDGSPPRLKVEIENNKIPAQILEIEQLSDGYRNLLAVILDFSRRLAQAHPNWNDPLQAPGILLIDEIELHLHPRWQQRIIPSLRSIFPNTQLVVTTHSPQVLTTVEKEKILILRDNVLHPTCTNTLAAESGRVMLEVMSTENRPPDNEITKRLHRLFTLINQKNLSEALMLHQTLTPILGNDDPALIEAYATINNLEWEKELGL